MEQALKVKWFDHGREPQCEPDPDFPDGKDIDSSFGADKTCFTDLPYPARRCGLFLVICNKCKMSVAITTAGRPDDPRSVKVACKAKPH